MRVPTALVVTSTLFQYIYWHVCSSLAPLSPTNSSCLICSRTNVIIVSIVFSNRCFFFLKNRFSNSINRRKSYHVCCPSHLILIHHLFFACVSSSFLFTGSTSFKMYSCLIHFAENCCLLRFAIYSVKRTMNDLKSFEIRSIEHSKNEHSVCCALLPTSSVLVFKNGCPCRSSRMDFSGVCYVCFH